MSDSILVAVDGSPLSEKALRHALKTFPGAEITAYHVVDLFDPDFGTHPDRDPTYEPMIGTDDWYAQAEAHTDDLFEAVGTVAAEHDRVVTTDSDIGEPARLVLEYADEADVDHIVLGAHGREWTDRALFGSEAETVVRRARVPVTVVR
jgi:nucleotide-binding universal stress UspA family protein